MFCLWFLLQLFSLGIAFEINFHCYGSGSWLLLNGCSDVTFYITTAQGTDILEHVPIAGLYKNFWNLHTQSGSLGQRAYLYTICLNIPGCLLKWPSSLFLATFPPMLVVFHFLMSARPRGIKWHLTAGLVYHPVINDVQGASIYFSVYLIAVKPEHSWFLMTCKAIEYPE